MGLMGRRSSSSADATFEVRFSREAGDDTLREARETETILFP